MAEEKSIFSQFIESIVSSITVGLVTINTELRTVSINPAAEKMMGIKGKEYLGSPLEALVNAVFSSEDSARLIGTVKRRLIDSGEKSIELAPDKLRRRIIVNTTVFPLISDEQKIVGTAIVLDDVTELKRAQEREKELAATVAVATERKKSAELEKAYRELQESRDNLIRSEKLAYTGRIAAGIAHEIRNPLTTVAMSIQQLKKVIKLKYPEVKYPKYVEIIEKSTERANFLITELVNCARPPKLNLEPYDVHRVLKYVLESIKTKVGSRKIKIVKKFAAKPLKIGIDKEQLGRAFLNIVTNAIEAIPKRGKLTIITEVRGDALVVEIQDTGKGIPEEDIIRVFDPFFSTKPGGVGLGLTLCYGIIVSHGGTIEVESKRKKGTIFTVSFPIGRR